jgi:hypothetical protein
MDQPKTISDLFDSKPRRGFVSISVDLDTFEIVQKVAEITKRSKPAVLAALVSTAYSLFMKEAQAAGIDPTKHMESKIEARKVGRKPYLVDNTP